jgi:hypothetical protein
VVLKLHLSRKTTRKVRAVEVPFGGLKTQKQLRCAEMGDSSKNLILLYGLINRLPLRLIKTILFLKFMSI